MKAECHPYLASTITTSTLTALILWYYTVYLIYTYFTSAAILCQHRQLHAVKMALHAKLDDEFAWRGEQYILVKEKKKKGEQVSFTFTYPCLRWGSLHLFADKCEICYNCYNQGDSKTKFTVFIYCTIRLCSVRGTSATRLSLDKQERDSCSGPPRRERTQEGLATSDGWA